MFRKPEGIGTCPRNIYHFCLHFRESVLEGRNADESLDGKKQDPDHLSQGDSPLACRGGPRPRLPRPRGGGGGRRDGGDPRRHDAPEPPPPDGPPGPLPRCGLPGGESRRALPRPAGDPVGGDPPRTGGARLPLGHLDGGHPVDQRRPVRQPEGEGRDRRPDAGKMRPAARLGTRPGPGGRPRLLAGEQGLPLPRHLRRAPLPAGLPEDPACGADAGDACRRGHPRDRLERTAGLRQSDVRERDARDRGRALRRRARRRASSGATTASSICGGSIRPPGGRSGRRRTRRKRRRRPGSSPRISTRGRWPRRDRTR